MVRSSAPVSSLAYQISTSNDPTRIYRTPIAFRGQDFLSSAASWTKHKLFPGDGGAAGSPRGGGDGGGTTGSSPPISNNRNTFSGQLGSGSSRNHHGSAGGGDNNNNSLLGVSITSGGLVVCIYSSSVQVWRDEVSNGGVLEFVGSTHGIVGSIVDVAVTESPGVTSGTADNSRATGHTVTLVIQVLRSRAYYLEIHQISREPSLVNTLVLPPASFGPGPYQVITSVASPYMAVVTSSGLVTLFAIDGYHPLALSGLEVACGPDGSALLDLQGRWLALTPKTSADGYKSARSNRNGTGSGAHDVNGYGHGMNGSPNGGMGMGSDRKGGTGNANGAKSNRLDYLPNAHTPVNLPPSGPLYERVMESLSATAVTSLKSLSEAGYSGIKYYLSKDGSGQDQFHSSVSGGGNGAAGRSGPNSPSPGSSLKSLSKFLFSDQSSTSLVQIIDIPSETSICCFSPLEGLSYLSLSPYDTTLLTVSSKGDHMYTYDISYLPREVTVTGRYARGKVPARIKRVAWDTRGGFGLVTQDRGSLHWFDKRISFDTSTNKIWKLSNWGIEDMTFVNGAFAATVAAAATAATAGAKSSKQSHRKSGRDRESHLLLLKQGQLLISDPTSGQSTWKYDLPEVAISDPYKVRVNGGTSNSNENASGDSNGDPNYLIDNFDGEMDDGYDNEVLGLDDTTDATSPSSAGSAVSVSSSDLPPRPNVDPLAFFELETCLPYPFIHEDRRITISTTEFWDTASASCMITTGKGSSESYPVLAVFGLDIPSKPIDFGKAKGEAKFTPSEDLPNSEGNLDLDDAANGEALRRAMESLVLTHPPSPQPSKPSSPSVESDSSHQGSATLAQHYLSDSDSAH
ncbi:hypothetical protein AWJ20_1402 [Sugiyamaella lignohabitans]|uniref:Uncharacterized protein n=1 Tax=Sugiyamaella lignohabitans TaxID=796027 RepID=A0A167DNZ8_9ASCO|nr:uncharacterized protein AWJ20_1402 [Sugiyamaella lignohabitans]ANB13121.1 hypothetical protein AWJ20_1402 [Sugiyamaella lignohabitans]